MCDRLTAISNPIPKIPNSAASLGLVKEKRFFISVGLCKCCKWKEGTAQILKIHTCPRAKLFYFYSWFYFKIVIAVLDEMHLYLWETPELGGCHPVKQLGNTWDYWTESKRFCTSSYPCLCSNYKSTLRSSPSLLKAVLFGQVLNNLYHVRLLHMMYSCLV